MTSFLQGESFYLPAMKPILFYISLAFIDLLSSCSMEKTTSQEELLRVPFISLETNVEKGFLPLPA